LSIPYLAWGLNKGFWWVAADPAGGHWPGPGGGELVVGDDAKEIADQPVSRNVSLRGLLAERKDEPDALIQGF